MKLKTKASLIMAATVALALLTIGWAFHLFLAQSLRKTLNAGLEGVAHTAADSIQVFAADNLRDAQAVAANFPLAALENRDPDLAERYLERMREVFPQFQNGLFVLDAQGVLWADTPRSEKARGQGFAFREYFQRTMREGRGVVGQPYQSARTGEPVCTFTAPLRGASGAIRGLVGCSVRLASSDHLGLLQHQRIGEHGYLYIFDSTRMLILHPDASRVLKRDAPRGVNLLVDRALEGFEGVGETVNSRGVRMLAAFKRVPGTDWIVGAQQPLDEALSPLNEMRLRLLLGIAVAALLAMLVGWVAVRRVTKPLADLRRATASLGQDGFNLGPAVYDRRDEIGDLAKSFRDITNSLRENFANLQAVERRLRATQSVAQVGSWELDLSQLRMWGSEEAFNIYGLESRGQNWLPLDEVQEIPLPQDRQRLDKALRDLMVQGSEYSLEYRIRRPSDGALRTVFSNAQLLRDEEGTPLKVLGTIQDITALKAAEENARRRSEELTTLNFLGREISTSLSLEHTSRAVLKGVLEALGPDLVFLFLIEGGRLTLKDIQPAPARLRLGEMPEHQVGECLCGLAAKLNQPLFSRDIVADERCTWPECKKAGLKSLAALPLRSGEELIGVLGLASDEERDFARQADFLETLAAQAAVAIANAHLFEAVSRELAERQRTERALKESEDRFKVLSEKSPLGIKLIDKDGRYEYINPAFVKTFGYTLADIPTGQQWFHLAYPDEDYRRQVIAAWVDDKRHYPEGESRPRTFRVTCRDGQVKTILFRAVSIPSGKQLVICEDITERQGAEEALRRSEEKYRQILEGTPDPVVLYDTEGRVVYLNPAFTQVFGWTQEELVGRSIDYVPEEELPRTKELLEVLKRGESRIGFETRRYDKWGKVLDVSISWSGWLDEKGAPAGGVVVLRDVTERKKMVAQLEQSRRMEAIGVLAGGIAHDFNNVLQAISGGVQLLLLKSGQDEASREILAGIDHMTLRAAEMVRKLLAVSRKQEANLKPMQLNQEIEHVCGLLKRVIPGMIGLELRLAPDLWLIKGDQAQLEQVILNMAGNAVDAMPEGGQLAFSTENLDLDEIFCRTHPELKPGPHVLLRVADTGSGMDQETIEHIFEPFFTTKQDGKGTGLGLSTVYGIINQHLGLITCYSAPGQGTVFNIYLPASVDTGHSPAESAGRPEESLRGGNETILLVDDEKVILDLGAEILGMYGYRVLEASSGEDALALYQKHGQEIALVILDLSMPGMGGQRCLELLLDLNPQAKVLVSSGYYAPDGDQSLQDAGAAGFIGKPYRLTEMIKRVREVLDQGAARS